MRATADAVFIGTEPWTFLDKESGEQLTGTTSLWVTPESTEALKLSLPKNPQPSLPALIPMDWYELDLDFSKRSTANGASVSLKLVNLHPIDKPIS